MRGFKTKKQQFIALVILLVLLISVGGSAIALYAANRQAANEQQLASKQQATIAASVAQSIGSEFSGDLADLNLATQLAALKSTDVTACDHQLDQLIAAGDLSVVSLSRLSTTGNITCSSDRSLVGKSATSLGFDAAIFGGNHQPVISRRLPNRGASGPAVAVEVPLKGDHGEFLGILSGIVSMRDIQARYLNKAKLTDASAVSLFDNNKDILEAPNPTSETKNIGDQSIKDNLGGDYDQFVHQVDLALGGTATTLRYSVTKNPRLAAIAPVAVAPGHNWTLIVSQSLADIATANGAAATQRLIIESLLLYALLAAAVGAGGVYFIISRILKPIERVSAAAIKFGQGDFGKSLPAGDDEIGQLAKSFNIMTAELKDYYAGLEKKVEEKTAELARKVAEAESQNKTLDDTKRAVMNILEDLSSEKAQVEADKARDEILLESIGEGLVATDESGNITNLNTFAANQLGYDDAKPLIGKWFPSVIVMTDEFGKPIPPAERSIIQALSTGEVVTESTRFYKRKDGSVFPVFVSVSPVVIDERPVGAIEVFRDITHEKELERAKEEFVSLASHQLRTPASGVKAFTSMLMDGYAGKLTAKQKEFLQKVYDSNERQLRIVDDMLSVARVDAGRLTIEKVPTDVVELLEKTAAEEGAVVSSRRQNLTINKPKHKITAVLDPEKLRMVIDNLVSNASKYTPEEGKIELTLDSDDHNVILKVSDNGVGINKADLKKLFKKFSRIDNELSTQVGGTGLGLYLVKNIIDLHGGKIEVTSPGLNKGSVFIVRVPLKPAPVAAPTPIEEGIKPV